MSETASKSPSAEAPASQTRRQTALMKRLARMHDHADFPRAMQHVPPTEEALERAGRSVRWGGVLALVGALLVWRSLAGASGAGQILGVALGATGLVFGLRMLLQGLAQRTQTLSRALERRVALVADRRSETDLNWFGGRTTYFFQLEFDDGTNGEFRYPGRGVADDLLVKGNTGVAFLRGDTLIAWKNIKV